MASPADGVARQRHLAQPTVTTAANDLKQEQQQSKATIRNAAVNQLNQNRPPDRPLTTAPTMHARAACPLNHQHQHIHTHHPQQHYNGARFTTAQHQQRYTARAQTKPSSPLPAAAPTAGGGFSTSKTLFILAVILGCFAMLYPRIFHPMIRGVFHHHDDGLPSSPSSPLTLSVGGGDSGKLITPPELLDPALRRIGPPPIHQTPMGGGGGRRGPHPGMRGHEHHGSRGGGSSKGYIGTLLPLYAIGVIGFLCFTLFKILFKSKNNDNMVGPGVMPSNIDPRRQAYYAANGVYQTMAHNSPAAVVPPKIYHHHPNCPSSSGCEMHTKPPRRFPIIDALRSLQVNGETLADAGNIVRGAKRKIVDDVIQEADTGAASSGIMTENNDVNESVAGDFDHDNAGRKADEPCEAVDITKPLDLHKVQQKMAETQHKIDTMQRESMTGSVVVEAADFLEIQQQMFDMQRQMQAMMEHIKHSQNNILSTGSADEGSTSTTIRDGRQSKKNDVIQPDVATILKAADDEKFAAQSVKENSRNSVESELVNGTRSKKSTQNGQRANMGDVESESAANALISQRDGLELTRRDGEEDEAQRRTMLPPAENKTTLPDLQHLQYDSQTLPDKQDDAADSKKSAEQPSKEKQNS